jgi:hypothetical protein
MANAWMDDVSVLRATQATPVTKVGIILWLMADFVFVDLF